MTDGQDHQEYASRTMRNAAFLQVGMEAHVVSHGADELNSALLQLGQLQTLCAMVALGDAGEKAFARKRLKKFIADGRRIDLRKAKSVPQPQGALT